MRLRPGYLLVEALCALVLAGLLAAVAVGTLQAARRIAAREEALDRGLRAEREAVAILAGELRRGDVPAVLGDTALELDVLLGTSAVCGVGLRSIDLPAPAESGVSEFALAPGRDDLIALRLSPTADTWWYSAVDSVQVMSAPADCDAASGWQSTTAPTPLVLRLVTFDTVPAEVGLGAELRVQRRGRYVLYHGGDGGWMLGYRRCHPFLAVCGVVQPVAGPLRTPSAGGLRLRLQDDPRRVELAAYGVGGRGATAVVHQ